MNKLAIVFWVMVSAAPAAEAVSAEEVVAGLQRFYDSLEDFRATFQQSYFSRTMGKSKVSEGTLYTKKPGKMRWDYRRPARRHFLINGGELTIYDPELEQVMVDRNFTGSELTSAMSFLLGQGKLTESFTFAFDQREDLRRPGSYLLKLTPRRPAAFRHLWLVVRQSDFQVSELFIEDTADNTNHLVFSKVAINRKLKDSIFRLVIPPGVEVIEAPRGSQSLQP